MVKDLIIFSIGLCVFIATLPLIYRDLKKTAVGIRKDGVAFDSIVLLVWFGLVFIADLISIFSMSVVIYFTVVPLLSN